MVLILVPIAAWSKLGTAVTWLDLWRATKAPFFSGLLAGAAGLLEKLTLSERLPLIPHLLIGVGVVLGIYGGILLIVMNQKDVYIELLSHLWLRLQVGREKRA
jgi:hypothetical protein